MPVPSNVYIAQNKRTQSVLDFFCGIFSSLPLPIHPVHCCTSVINPFAIGILIRERCETKKVKKTICTKSETRTPGSLKSNK